MTTAYLDSLQSRVDGTGKPSAVLTILVGIIALCVMNMPMSTSNSIVWQSSYHGTFWGYGYPDSREGMKVEVPGSLTPFLLADRIRSIPGNKCDALFYIRHWRHVMEDKLEGRFAPLYAECVNGNQFKIHVSIDKYGELGGVIGIWPTSGVSIRPTYPKR